VTINKAESSIAAARTVMQEVKTVHGQIADRSILESWKLLKAVELTGFKPGRDRLDVVRHTPSLSPLLNAARLLG
jgi:hypothetical protein